MVFSVFYSQLSSRLTNRSKKVLEKGCAYSWSDDQKELRVEYILHALVLEHGSLGNKILSDFTIKSPIKRKLPVSRSASGRDKMLISKDVRVALLKAFHTAFQYGQRFVGTEHLLYGIVTTHTLQIS